MSMSDIFDVDIEDGETPSDAKKRIERLKEEERIRIERLRFEKEERRRKALELKAKEIELFNRDIGKAVLSSKFDWFKYDYNTYVLLTTPDTGFIISRIEQSLFQVCKVINNKTIKSIDVLNESNNLKECISDVEDSAVRYGSSYCRKNSKWKLEPATEKQLQYINDKFKSGVKTKWDASKYYFNRSLWSMLKKLNNQR